MDSYNKKVVSTAAVISTLGSLFGISFWWVTRNFIFMNIGLIVVGLQAIYFSRDLAMEGVVNHKANYKITRRAYVVIGILFVLSNILWILKDQGLF